MPSLTKRQLKGITKLGNILCPGTAKLPAFSSSKALTGADRCFGYLTPEDQEGLGMLLYWLGVFPTFVAAFLIRLVNTANRWPKFISPLLRLLQIGLKGFVYSLYYSDDEIRKSLGYVTSVSGVARL